MFSKDNNSKAKIKNKKNKIGKVSTNIINIIIVAVIFVGLLIYMFAVDDMENIIHVIKNLNYGWLLVGLLCMFVYWALESLCLYVVTKKTYKKQDFFSSLRVSMIGQLFNCITPFSSGGQPMQAVAMVNEGKKISNSASILLIKFIVYQATLVVYTLLLIVFKYSYFKSLVSNFVYLALIGFLVNFAIIIFLVSIGINKKFVYKLISYFYRFFGKIRILKNVDKKLEKLKTSIDSFNKQFQIIKKEKWMITKLTVYSFIQLTVFFFVTYAVYRAFGQYGASVINIISAQAFLMMVMAFIPIPGAGIAAEGGFLVIFNTFFENGTINMAILTWRIYTFYLPIIVGAIFLFINNKKSDKRIDLNTQGVDLNVM